MDGNNKQSKRMIIRSSEDAKTTSTSTSTPILIMPQYSSSKSDSEATTSNSSTSSYTQCSITSSNSTNSNSSSINCAPKLSVHYIVSLNNDSSLFATQHTNNNKSIDVENHANHFIKIESGDSSSDRKCLISLPLENVTSSVSNECDAHSLKPNQSVGNQRLLISPTDFLTLSEEGMMSSHKNPEVKKDVNLSASSLEIIRRNNENSFSISLERYCESPLMLEHKDSQLICDDETSYNGRNSRLSETPEDINADDLFAATFETDQHSSLREVVTPLDGDNAQHATSMKELHKSKIMNHDHDESLLCESSSQGESDSKPILTVLDPLDAEENDCTSSSHTDSTFPIITSSSSQKSSNSSSQTVATALTALDIKVLPNGMLTKDSLLLANLAAALPSSLTSKQIAIQVIREDGTSIVLPLTATKAEINQTHTHSNNNNNNSHSKESGKSNEHLPESSSMLLAEVVSSSEAIRPFKCELCNSTFTRLGNYTRHKKIHSYPSKEDQRFRCEICSKSFIQRCDLARHLHIHRGTEPHRCPQCGKGYIRHSDLVTHQRFHNKEKPFACPHCSKGFCQRGDLNRHLRSIHLQLKPILCSHCHKKFAKEETLLRHINATHRDLVEDTQLK